MPRFDLRDEPWIPVRFRAGQADMAPVLPSAVGLRDLFLRAHEIEDIELPVPPAAAGLLRMLYAMAAHIARDGQTPLADEELAEFPSAWLQARNRVLARGSFDPDSVHAYFDEPSRADCFDLFHPERPFLQDPRLRQECTDVKGEPKPSGVNKLAFGRPTGANGAVLFGHFSDLEPVPIPAVEAVHYLIGQLYFGAPGRCTTRRLVGMEAAVSKAGPLRAAVSFHPWGFELFTSLVLGIPSCPDPELLGEDDAAAWEEELLPPAGPLPSMSWPGRLLTGRARHAVLLVPSSDGSSVTDAYVTWSSDQPASGEEDPYLVYDGRPNREGEFVARQADVTRAVWRDLDALLRRGRGRPDFRQPLIFADLVEVSPQLRDQVRVRVYGFDQDKAQQKDTSWYVATTPPVLGWLEEVDARQAVRITQFREAAEDLGRALSYAAVLAWATATQMPDDKGKYKIDRRRPGPWQATALTRYWSEAERLFWTGIETGQDAACVRGDFTRAAEEALRAAAGTAHADLHVARGLHLARRSIRKAGRTGRTVQLPGDFPDRGSETD
ncbi:type I-E CRISPR-associated protein Cse1/CasA [Streptomyces phytophilus]|uniref:type I-E CRISPR-associated protein Cse1/CasA n=1 Tax=Streptomyces phytophilus TaxID=722715 RepID=UPI0015F01963|nr:type I-E CRISPR-associated protein Cse1/CasA [Streptomyces phytophilus]